MSSSVPMTAPRRAELIEQACRNTRGKAWSYHDAGPGIGSFIAWDPDHVRGPAAITREFHRLVAEREQPLAVALERTQKAYMAKRYEIERSQLLGAGRASRIANERPQIFKDRAWWA